MSSHEDQPFLSPEHADNKVVDHAKESRRKYYKGKLDRIYRSGDLVLFWTILVIAHLQAELMMTGRLVHL
jgi:hypothetical protein